MQRFRYKTLQNTIFFFSSIIISIIVISFTLLYILTLTQNYLSNYTKSSKRLTNIISTQLDAVINNIDNIETRLIQSNSILNYVFTELPNYQINHTGNIYSKQSEFESIVTDIAGIDFGFSHLTILTKEGAEVNFGNSINNNLQDGYYFAFKNMDEKTERDTFGILSNSSSTIYITPPNEPKLIIDNNCDNGAISIYKKFSKYPISENKQAIIEIQLDKNMVENTIKKSMQFNDSISDFVVVYNNKNQLIYPNNLDNAYFNCIRSANGNTIKNPTTNHKEIITKYSSSYTGWTTCVITPNNALASTIKQQFYLTITLGVSALLFVLFITFIITKSVSSPLAKVRNILSKLELEDLSPEESSLLSYRCNELEFFGEVFRILQTRLDKSLEAHMHLQTLSIQSRLLALQAQMDPHFLYNTLSIITILAEENHDLQVSKMCHQLIDMLRYISSEKDYIVFEHELLHAKNYADLMSVRYGNKLNIIFNCDAIKPDLKMPPMLLQPLIENSVKYARQNGRELIISVYGYVQDERWYIDVIDNGNGFTQEFIDNFNQLVRKVDSIEQIIEHGIKGIGIANIYTRMKLHYREDFTFNISNIENGAKVTIGGTMKDKWEESNNANRN